MAQLQLPVFPQGVTQLSTDLGVSCCDGRVSYFYGTLPVFTHGEKDVKSFRLFTSQLYLEGKVKQADLVKVFGVSAISLAGGQAFEAAGREDFQRPVRTGPLGAHAEVLKQAQEQLDQGRRCRKWRCNCRSARHCARRYAKRLHETVKKENNSPPALRSDLAPSQRSERRAAPLGVATHDVTAGSWRRWAKADRWIHA
jgi:hypothetical protein